MTMTAPQRKFHIQFKHAFGMGKTTYITNEDFSQTFYSILLNTWKSTYTLHEGKDNKENSELGVAKIHWAKSIDCNINGTSMEVTNNAGWVSKEFKYFSPAMNQNVRWSSKSVISYGDIVLLDENEMSIARYHPKCASLYKQGSFEIEEGRTLSKEAIEEILLIGFSIVNYRNTQTVVLT